jgi:hypothetical protein
MWGRHAHEARESGSARSCIDSRMHPFECEQHKRATAVRRDDEARWMGSPSFPPLPFPFASPHSPQKPVSPSLKY